MAVAVVPPLFNPTVLTTAAVAIYTAPASPLTLVVARMRVRFTNTTAGPITVTAYAVPTGSAAAGNCCANAESIAANNHIDLDIPQLGPGWAFQALASANTSITVTLLDAVTFS